VNTIPDHFLPEWRVRTRIPPQQLRALEGKPVTGDQYQILLTGPAKVFKPNGQPLAIYLPRILKPFTAGDTYDIFRELSMTGRTSNRGLASGTQRVQRGTQLRSYAKGVPSVIAGSFDPSGIYKYCRQTAWTGENLAKWEALRSFFQAVAEQFAFYVPDRYRNQAEAAARTKPEWVIPGTPFTTVTVNNSYPTGMHTDKGDLDAGFSTIACFRRGTYTGGQLCFPEYGLAADLQDGDLILMDAHEWHANTPLVCECGTVMDGPCKTCGAERVSVVTYYRTKLEQCGTADEEFAKAIKRGETRNKTDEDFLRDMETLPDYRLATVSTALHIGDQKAARLIIKAHTAGMPVTSEQLATAQERFPATTTAKVVH
jgi:Oxygenase domain of the 2OGFeDO superfamily